MPPHPQTDDARARKARLICQECGHESPVDGDWAIDQRHEGRPREVYTCPDCEAVVTVRPKFRRAVA